MFAAITNQIPGISSELVIAAIISIGLLVKKFFKYLWSLKKKEDAAELEDKIKVHTDPILKATSENTKNIGELSSYIKYSFSENGDIGKRLKHTHHDVKDVSAKKDGAILAVLDGIEEMKEKIEKIENNNKNK